MAIKHIKSLDFHAHECAGESRHCRIKLRRRMLLNRIAQAGNPRLKVG
jgi:hypothetical protein